MGLTGLGNGTNKIGLTGVENANGTNKKGLPGTNKKELN
jgi:hypothetical protein